MKSLEKHLVFIEMCYFPDFVQDIFLQRYIFDRLDIFSDATNQCLLLLYAPSWDTQCLLLLYAPSLLPEMTAKFTGRKYPAKIAGVQKRHNLSGHQ